ncbi:hypothetical protein HDU67_010174 [Dinochytrium kinnereticum]|nr:hypothetical protein HDU67_010174 [Dinochytrium kinnereticum]
MGNRSGPDVCILCELRLLCPGLPQLESVTGGSHVKTIACVQDLSIEDLFATEEVKQFFSANALTPLKTNDFKHYARTLISNHLAAQDGLKADREFTVIMIAATFLLAFLQSNWTGPSLNFPTNYFLPKDADIEDLEKAAFTYLSIDDEEVYKLTQHILLLAMARAILVDNRDLFSELKLVDWWSMRTLFIQQRILENPAGTAKDYLVSKIDIIKALPVWENVSEDLRKKVLSHLALESGLIFGFYGEIGKAKPKYVESQELSGLKWNMTGALGRRTKFQEFDVAQLVVKAESASIDDKKGDEASAPKTLALNDDTLLESIQFTTPKDIDDPTVRGNLNPQDQCILLSFCLNVQNENPEDGLTTAEMVPYVTRVLENPNNWTIHTMSLLLRSRLESKRSRTAERSALQLQALVDQIPALDSTVSERLRFFFSVIVPPKWDLEKELGERFVSLGVVKSALEIFERLHMWDEAVSCMQMLGKSKEAEEIVRKQLETAPGSPKLHCLLGDILKDPQYYYEAWSLSRFKYARAMRSLGAHFFREGDFKECIECYRKGLEINPLFENSWFVMGCAALRAEDWESAEEAFRRTISLDHNNGEAWTNLASVYIRKNLKREAWRALKEALRQHHDNSKIWDNYLFISTDLGEFSEAILAMRQILDIRTRHTTTLDVTTVIDFDVLQIIVTAVMQGVKAADQTSATALAGRLSALLTAYKEKFSTSALLYSICADFALHVGRKGEALENRLKAYRLYLQNPEIASDEKVFRNGVRFLRLYVGALKELGDLEDVFGEGDVRRVCPDWRYQARSTLRTFIGRTKDSFDGTEELEGLREMMNEFKSILELRASKCIKLRGQAFVTFEELENATKALNEAQGFPLFSLPMDIQYARDKNYRFYEAEGRLEDVKRRRAEEKARKATEPKKPKPEASIGSTGWFPGGAPIPAEFLPPNSILFVENLPPETTQQILTELFNQFPGFKEVRLVPGKSDIAFVEYDSEAQSTLARQQLNHFKINSEREMKVTFARK